MRDLFVPYEIALKLKDKGFDEPCFGTYGFNNIEPKKFYLPEDIKEEFNERIEFSDIVNGINGDDVAAPLWQQVSKWFRIVHNVYLIEQVTIDSRGDIFYYRVVKKGKVYSHSEPSEDSSKALEYAIQHALTLI